MKRRDTCFGGETGRDGNEKETERDSKLEGRIDITRIRKENIKGMPTRSDPQYGWDPITSPAI